MLNKHICPCCTKEMNENQRICTTNSSNTEVVWYRKCDRCNIIDDDVDGWCVPNELLPTEKQLNTIQFICYELNKKFKPITKRDAWRFINVHFSAAKYINKRHAV